MVPVEGTVRYWPDPLNAAEYVVVDATDVIIVLFANCPVPLLTTGVAPIQPRLVVPLANVIVEAELEAVVVLLYKFHCIDPEPAPGAGNTVAAILIFTLKKRLLF